MFGAFNKSLQTTIANLEKSTIYMFIEAQENSAQQPQLSLCMGMPANLNSNSLVLTSPVNEFPVNWSCAINQTVTNTTLINDFFNLLTSFASGSNLHLPNLILNYSGQTSYHGQSCYLYAFNTRNVTTNLGINVCVAPNSLPIFEEAFIQALNKTTNTTALINANLSLVATYQQLPSFYLPSAYKPISSLSTALTETSSLAQPSI